MPRAGGHAPIWEQTPPEIHAVPVEPFGGIEACGRRPRPKGPEYHAAAGATKLVFGAATGETTMQTQHGA